MKWIFTKDYQILSRRAAALIAAQVSQKPDCVLGLATGSSPLGIYEQLIKWYQADELDFSQVHAANLDEYEGLAADHPQSYAYFMKENLFRHINIDQVNTYIPSGVAPDGDAECTRYDALIRELGGVDLQLLGIGHNGHIGFNEPAEDFPAGTHRVALTVDTIEANARFFSADEVQPDSAYTMGIGTIMAAKSIVLIASGAGKAEIIRDSFFGPVTPKVPASILQFHPNVTVVVDEAAAALIPRK